MLGNPINNMFGAICAIWIDFLESDKIYIDL